MNLNSLREILKLSKRLDEQLKSVSDLNSETIEHLDQERSERVEVNRRLEALRIDLSVLSRNIEDDLRGQS